MNPYIDFDFEKTPAVLDRIAESFDEASSEYQALMAGKQALIILGKDAAKDYARRSHEAFPGYKKYLESLDRPPTEYEILNLSSLAHYEDPSTLHHELPEAEIERWAALHADKTEGMAIQPESSISLESRSANK